MRYERTRTRVRESLSAHTTDHCVCVCPRCVCLHAAVGSAIAVSFFLANGFSPDRELLKVTELPTKADEYVKHSAQVRLTWARDGSFDRELALKIAKKHKLQRAAAYIEG